MSPLSLPLALPTQSKPARHTLTRRSVGASLSQGLITIVIVLFLVTLLFFFLRRNARRQSEERKVLKVAHLRGTGTDVGGEGQVRGSEDTLVEGRGGRGGNGEVRMEMGMVPMGLTTMRPMVYAGGRSDMDPPPAYEARMNGASMAAGPVMPAAHLPGR